MDLKNKIFLTLVLLVTIIMVGVSFYRYEVAKDFQISTRVDCDPGVESCFVSFCDINEDSTCPADPKEATSYYKVISKKASRMPDCDPNSDGCALTCDNDNECRVVLCEGEPTDTGDTCSDQEAVPQKTDLNQN